MLAQEAKPPMPGRVTKITHEKWLIRPISPASAEIASENMAYLLRQVLNGAF